MIDNPPTVSGEDPTISDWQLAFLGTMFVLLVIALITLPAHAQTITMSNPGSMSERDIAVYYPNGTMHGLWNSSSVIPLDGNESYIFALKPIQTNPFDDPTDWFVNSFLPAVKSNALVLIFIAFIVSYLALRRR